MPADQKPVTETAWFNSPALKHLFTKMLNKGDEIRIVGGAARNHLLNEVVNDIDLATTYTPDQVMERAKIAGIKIIPTGIDHGTVTLLIDDKSFELTTLRKDVTTDGRHAVVEFGTDWHEDAKRRDFTINALYISADGTWHDPLGTGFQDIKTRTIRFIGSAQKRIREDYLRILRFYRFNAYYGSAPYDEEAITATIQLRAGLATLSNERVSSELLKILKAPAASEILKLLYQTGLLTNLLGTAPNISKALKLINIENYLEELNPDPALRLASLAAWAPDDADRIKQRFRLSNQQQKILEIWLNSRSFPPITDQVQQNTRNFHSGKNIYLIEIKSAWTRSSSQTNDADWACFYKESQNKTLPEFPLTGQDLIDAGYPAGPQIGEKIKELQEIWLKGDMLINKHQLLADIIKT